MIELVKNKQHQVIKRDDSVEPYSAEKLRAVLMWAAENKEAYVDEILQDLNLKIHDNIRIVKLFDTVIETVANKISAMYPFYDTIARNLFLQKIYKDTWDIKRTDGDYPHYSKVLKRGVHLKSYSKEIISSFSEEEIDALNSFIDPRKDYKFDYLGLNIFMDKYSMNAIELPQHGFMRLAMFAFWKEPKEIRLDLIKQRYDNLSDFVYSEATPKWISSLKDDAQMASCVVATVSDDSRSINKTINNLGLFSKYGGGLALDVSRLRSSGSKIGTTGKSSGPVPFIKMLESTVMGYNQNGVRKGACAVYYNWWHYDVRELLQLKNEGGTEDTRARNLQYGFKINRLLLERFRLDQDITLFDPKDTPELLDTFGSAFETYYEQYESRVGIRKKTMKARDLLWELITQLVDTGNIYLFFTENVHEQTPFNEVINSSNLCVTGDTNILTRDGYRPIEQLVGQTVECWNGEQWSFTELFKTSDSSKVLTVTLSNSMTIRATPYHKWYIGDDFKEVRTNELKQSDVLSPWSNPDGSSTFDVSVVSVEDLGETMPTYCGTEPLRNKLMFNGVLAGNCNEVFLPTTPVEFKESKLISSYGSKELISEETYDPGMIALCNLSSINLEVWDKMDDKSKQECAYNLLRASDNLIDYAYYPVNEGKVSNMKYRSIGIGMSNLAQYLASKETKFSDEQAESLMQDITEDIYYHFLTASAQLAGHRGPFEGYYETKLSKGWLPKDSAKIPLVDLKKDWGKLKDLISRHGLRFATIGAVAPTATSSLMLSATEGVQPIKNLVSDKTGNYSCKQIAPKITSLRKHYELAWDVPNKSLIKLAAIRQAFIDQGQSTDTFYKTISAASEIMDNILYAEQVGLKGMYYMNQLKADEHEACESCSA